MNDQIFYRQTRALVLARREQTRDEPERQSQTGLVRCRGVVGYDLWTSFTDEEREELGALLETSRECVGEIRSEASQ